MSRLQYTSVFFSIFRSPFFSRLQWTSAHFTFLFQYFLGHEKTLHEDHLISAFFSKLHLSFSVDFSRHQYISVHFITLHLSKYHFYHIFCSKCILFTTSGPVSVHFTFPIQSTSVDISTLHVSNSVDRSRLESTSVDRFQQFSR